MVILNDRVLKANFLPDTLAYQIYSAWWLIRKKTFKPNIICYIKGRDEIVGVAVLFYCFTNAWSAFKY